MLLGNTLFINTLSSGDSGASVISERNYELLSLNSKSITKYSTELSLKNARKNLKTILFNFNLVSKIENDSIINLIVQKNINTVFIDTSLLGNFSKGIKKKFPNIYLISFFHNVEYDYFIDLIKVSRKKHHYFTLQLVRKAENQLLKYSDVVITLNRRDSNSLKRHYCREADLILPTSFIDKYDHDLFQNKQDEDVLNILFVGSYFPPNVYGIDWFIANVLPLLKRKVVLYVVGNGFESHRLNVLNDSVKLIGRVADLNSYYYAADVVIAPIFHGSGMKTKVAEALMFNKPVIGTREAFEGYEVNSDEMGKECNTAEEFINSIENFTLSKMNTRNVFLQNFSFEAIKNKFHIFLNNAK